MHRPRIKEVLQPTRHSENRIRLGGIQFGAGSMVSDNEHGHIWRLMGLMDGTRTTENIVVEMLQIASELDEESIYAAIVSSP